MQAYTDKKTSEGQDSQLVQLPLAPSNTGIHDVTSIIQCARHHPSSRPLIFSCHCLCLCCYDHDHSGCCDRHCYHNSCYVSCYSWSELNSAWKLLLTVQIFTDVPLDERRSRSKRASQMKLHYVMSKIQNQVQGNYKISELPSKLVKNCVICYGINYQLWKNLLSQLFLNLRSKMFPRCEAT